MSGWHQGQLNVYVASWDLNVTGCCLVIMMMIIAVIIIKQLPFRSESQLGMHGLTASMQAYYQKVSSISLIYGVQSNYLNNTLHGER